VQPLKEIRNVRQVPGEHARRWFTSAELDLIVWVDGSGDPLGFQLCYDKGPGEKALTRTTSGEVSHACVDDGENRRSGYKETPVLVSGASFDGARVAWLITRAGEDLPEPFFELVMHTIVGHSGFPPSSSP